MDGATEIGSLFLRVVEVGAGINGFMVTMEVPHLRQFTLAPLKSLRRKGLRRKEEPQEGQRMII